MCSITISSQRKRNRVGRPPETETGGDAQEDQFQGQYSQRRKRLRAERQTQEAEDQRPSVPEAAAKSNRKQKKEAPGRPPTALQGEENMMAKQRDRLRRWLGPDENLQNKE